MNREAIANLYSNVFSIGWFPPEARAEVSAFLKPDAIGRQTFPVTLAGTGFLLESVLGITAAHVLDRLTREMSIGPEQTSLFFMNDRGGRFVEMTSATLGPNFRTFRATRPDEEPSRTGRLPIQPETDFELLPLPKLERPSTGPSLSIGDVTQIRVGDPVYIAGYLLGSRLTDLPDGTHRLGPVVIKGRIAAILPLGVSWSPAATGLLVDATVAGGLSGAPVCNEDGLVIGLLTGGVEKPVKVRGSAEAPAMQPNHQHSYEVRVPMGVARVLPMTGALLQMAQEAIATLQETTPAESAPGTTARP